MSEAIEYLIVTIEDFAKVPRDRLRDCLTVFVHCQLEVTFPIEKFIWVDDGIPLIQHVQLHRPNGDIETIRNPNFPKKEEE